MKIEKIEKSTFKEIVENFEQHMFRGLVMTMLLCTLLFITPKEWSIFVYFAIFINLVMIAFVVATFKQDITYKSILDAVETTKWALAQAEKEKTTEANTETETDGKL